MLKKLLASKFYWLATGIFIREIMPLYESVIICRQDITKNQLDQIISDFKDHLI